MATVLTLVFFLASYHFLIEKQFKSADVVWVATMTTSLFAVLSIIIAVFIGFESLASFAFAASAFIFFTFWKSLQLMENGSGLPGGAGFSAIITLILFIITLIISFTASIKIEEDNEEKTLYFSMEILVIWACLIIQSFFIAH